MAALWRLQEMAPERAAELAAHLSTHPDARISQHFAERAVKRFIPTERGGCELAYVPGGTFRMGSSQAEIERSKEQWPQYETVFDDEAPEHEVEVSGFYLGTHAVTNEEYGLFLAENPGAHEPERWADPAWNDPKQPVVAVSWEDAQAFCRWAGACLPTEAEWEYACCAGAQTRYGSGDAEEDLARVGWYSKNSDGRAHVVGEKPANKYGLFDMHGNAWEWCEDWYGPYSSSRQKDPKGAAAGAGRVLRGGSYWNVADSRRQTADGSHGGGAASCASDALLPLRLPHVIPG
jgi:formylglycine-generating enzyme required for sulfatase activity